MFSFGCFAKKYKYTPWKNEGEREGKSQRSELLILVLLITNPVTRYLVQPGRMFLKSVLGGQVAATPQWQALSLGVSDVHHVWALEAPREPSIWTCPCGLLAVALQV